MCVCVCVLALRVCVCDTLVGMDYLGCVRSTPETCACGMKITIIQCVALRAAAATLYAPIDREVEEQKTDDGPGPLFCVDFLPY